MEYLVTATYKATGKTIITVAIEAESEKSYFKEFKSKILNNEIN